MKVSEHLTYGGFAAIALAPLFGFKTIFFFLGSVLIDIDHYIDFLYYGKFKDWSISKMFKFHGLFSKKVFKHPILALEAFHTVEFLIGWLLMALWLNSAELVLALYGMVFHLALDLIRLKKMNKIHHRALSFLEYWFRSKKMIREIGIHPEKIFREAYQTLT